MYIDIRYIQFDNTSSFNTSIFRKLKFQTWSLYICYLKFFYLDTDLDSEFLDEGVQLACPGTHEDNYIAEKSKDTLKYIVES